MTSKDIINDLIQNIINGNLKELTKLNSEAKLSEQYNCNRHTIRNSLNYLIDRGYLFKVHGGSTYINKLPVNHILNLSSMFDIHPAQEIKTIVLSLKKIKANSEISQKLQISENKAIWQIVRARYTADTFHHLETTYLPVSLFPSLKKEDCILSLMQYIETTLDIQISHGHKTIESCIFTNSECKTLNIEENSLALKISNIGFLTNGRVYEYSINKHFNQKVEFFAKK